MVSTLQSVNEAVRCPNKRLMEASPGIGNISNIFMKHSLFWFIAPICSVGNSAKKCALLKASLNLLENY